MSFELVQGTRPHGLEIKSYGFGPLANKLRIGEKMVPIAEILALAAKELKNAELPADDPRRWYATRLAGAREIAGYNPGGTRLEVVGTPSEPRSIRDAHIDVCGYALSVDDFVFTVNYVLTNSDLLPDDPRRAFIALFQADGDGVTTTPAGPDIPCPKTDPSPGASTRKSPS